MLDFMAGRVPGRVRFARSTGHRSRSYGIDSRTAVDFTEANKVNEDVSSGRYFWRDLSVSRFAIGTSISLCFLR
jgi:hypothetical protein